MDRTCGEGKTDWPFNFLTESQSHNHSREHIVGSGAEAEHRRQSDVRTQKDRRGRRAYRGDLAWGDNLGSRAAIWRFRSDTKGGETVDERRGVAKANPRTDDVARRS